MFILVISICFLRNRDQLNKKETITICTNWESHSLGISCLDGLNFRDAETTEITTEVEGNTGAGQLKTQTFLFCSMNVVNLTVENEEIANSEFQAGFLQQL